MTAVASIQTHLDDFFAAGIAAVVGAGAVSATTGETTLMDADLPEMISRRRRFKSVRISAADRYRKSGSFSIALLMICSNCGGSSGLKRSGETGILCRIASKITAEVEPENAC